MIFEQRLEGGMEGGGRPFQNNPRIFQNIPERSRIAGGSILGMNEEQQGGQ